MESSNGHAAATQTSNISESEVQNSLGCGCSNTNSTKSPTILISVTPTTGGQFEIPVLKSDTIENVKKIISKKLKVPRDRICLLHRERQLRDGSTVQENQLVEGSRLTLLPSVETGLLAQRPEQSVMQALESLNDSQVNDFLSGKAPLNLTMRLGDHMMLIQLQLSTISPSTSRRSATSTASSSSSSSSLSSSSSSSSSSSPKKSPCKVHSSSTVDIPIETAAMATTTSVCSSEPPSAAALKSQTSSMVDNIRSVPSSSSSLTTTSTSTSVPLCKNVPCKCGSTSTTKPLLDTRALAEASRNLTQTLKQLSSEVLTSKSDTKEESSSPSSACSSPSSSVPSSPTHTTSEHSLSSPSPSTSTSSTSCHSARESTSSSTSSTSSSSSSNSKRRQGAIIESMHHHGKGVYSGTFSGTLNPALQDKFGRPKRDISTIIHILNDLLCATPQYRAARSSASHATSVLDMGPASIDSAASASAAPIKSTSDISTNTDVKMLNSSSPADSLENQATRDKMERLRVVMEERRERRRAKRSAPYTCPSGSVLSTQWSAKSESRDVLSESMDTESTPTITPEPVVV
uniref:Midnolin-A n=1 Tax=Cacopsylla melanoneura TaxID=428564 RepID=A0A8D8Y9D9_9HEMI